MNDLKDDIFLIKELFGRPIAFHRAFVKFGGVTGALMLSQAIYWTPRTKSDYGWFYKSQEEWEEETGLTRYEQENARKRLKKFGILEEKKEGMPLKLFYRVNLSMLAENLLNTSVADMYVENQHTSMGETTIQACGKPPNSNRGKKDTIEYQRININGKNLKGEESPKPPSSLNDYLRRKEERKSRSVKGNVLKSKDTYSNTPTLDKDTGLQISLTDNVSSEYVLELAEKYNITEDRVLEQKEEYIDWVNRSPYDPKVWGKDMRGYLDLFCKRYSKKVNKTAKEEKSLFDQINEEYKAFPQYLDENGKTIKKRN